MGNVARGRIRYAVGNENNPADPFGRSDLVIQPDGRARLRQHTRGGVSTWIGSVSSSALERLFCALEEAGFPDVPHHPVPAGSSIRSLTVGTGDEEKNVRIAYHASLRGYDAAFGVLDTLVRQLSQDTLKGVAPDSAPIVDGVERVPVKPLTPGAVFLLAYLPAHRIAFSKRSAHVEREGALHDPALQHAFAFSRLAIAAERSLVLDVDMRRAELAAETGVPSSPDGDRIRSWLVTPALVAAWEAGEAARAVAVAAALAAHVAYFRASAPEEPGLRADASDHARELATSAVTLTERLRAIGLPAATRCAESLARMLSLTPDFESAPHGELLSLSGDLHGFFEGTARDLDAAPPALVTVEMQQLIFGDEEGWGALGPAVFHPARPGLQRVLERAFGLLREDSRRVLSGERRESVPPPSVTEHYARRAKLAEQVRARAMDPEDAWERLAPKTWLGYERRWLVCEKIAPDARSDGPTLSVAWASWVLRREPSSLDYVTTLCADPENVSLAEAYAIEACRLMSAWGFRTPHRLVWLAEESARLHAYRGARAFRERADEVLGLSFGTRYEAPRHVKVPTAGELAAKRDLIRANAWKKRAGVLGPNPFEPIVEIWRLGYALSAVLDDAIVLAASAPKLEELLEPLVV